MIPCYVAGKGMHATSTTWDFKTTVFELLQSSGMGYDTRYRYYQNELPELSQGELGRLICDPIESYDKAWPSYWANKKQGRDKEEVLTEYMLRLDDAFREEARVGIFCFDEAGLGTGINVMRFMAMGKPILGLYNPVIKQRGVNINNILQIRLDFPQLVTLETYENLDQLKSKVLGWLKNYSA